MEEYKLSYSTNYWECGDGCCDGTEYQIIISGIEIGWYSDLSEENFDALNNFINVLNGNSLIFKLIYSTELDEDGDLADVIYLNDTKITNSLWECNMFQDILDALGLKYEVFAYDLDWDIWRNEKRLVLVLETDDGTQ